MAGAQYWWGNREIKAPPVYTCSYEVDECTADILQNVTTLLDKAVKCLHCQIIWANEHKILQKVIYKGHNQFRHEKFMKALKKMNTSLKHYFELDLPQIIKNLQDNAPSVLVTRKTFQLPSCQMFEYALVRMMCGAQIMKQVHCYCLEAYRHISGQLNIGMFIPNMIVYAGLVGRIWALSYSKLKNIASIFKELRTVIDRVKGAKVKWLPEDAVIPQDIDDLINSLKQMNNFDLVTKVENVPKDWLEQFDISQEGTGENQLINHQPDIDMVPPVEKLFENATTEADLSCNDIGVPITRLDFEKHATMEECDDLVSISSHRNDKLMEKMKKGHVTSTPLHGHRQTMDIAMEVGIDFSPVVSQVTSPKLCEPMTNEEKSKWKTLINKAKNIQQLIKILDVLKENQPSLEKKYNDKSKKLKSLKKRNKVISNETDGHNATLDKGRKLVRKFLIQVHSQAKIKKESNSRTVKDENNLKKGKTTTLTTNEGGTLSNSFQKLSKVKKESLQKNEIKKITPIKAKSKKNSKLKTELKTSAKIQKHKSETRKQKMSKKQKF